jgi:hypothetical protein
MAINYLKIYFKCLGTVSTSSYFFISYAWAPSATVLLYSRLEKLGRGKHSSLFGPFVNYKT